MTELHPWGPSDTRDRTEHLDPSGAPAEANLCPACGAARLGALERAGEVRFRCEVCGAGWRFVLGRLWPLDV